MSVNLVLFCLFGIGAYLVGVAVANEAIINGEKAELDEFPYQVAVLFSNHLRCGGSILSAEYILSAAHCFISKDGTFLNRRFVILAGTNDLRRSNDLAERIEIQKIYIPAEYTPSVTHTTGDISVVKLRRPLKLSIHIQKIRLPRNQSETYAQQKAKITGYGWHWVHLNGTNESGGHNDTQLRFADTTILSNDRCQVSWDGVRTILVKQVCARVRQFSVFTANGVCTGDSGSGLVVNGNTVVGVLSMSALGCSELAHPAIYTRVSHYLTFIRSVMKNKITRYVRVHEIPAY